MSTYSELAAGRFAAQNYTGYAAEVTNHENDLVSEITITDVLPDPMIVIVETPLDFPQNYTLIKGVHYTKVDTVIAFTPELYRGSTVYLIDPATWLPVKTVVLSTKE